MDNHESQIYKQISLQRIRIIYIGSDLERRLNQKDCKCIKIDIYALSGPAPYGFWYYRIHEKNIEVKKGELIYFRNIDGEMTANYPSELIINSTACIEK